MFVFWIPGFGQFDGDSTKDEFEPYWEAAQKLKSFYQKLYLNIDGFGLDAIKANENIVEFSDHLLVEVNNQSHDIQFGDSDARNEPSISVFDPSQSNKHKPPTELPLSKQATQIVAVINLFNSGKFFLIFYFLNAHFYLF